MLEASSLFLTEDSVLVELILAFGLLLATLYLYVGVCVCAV